MRFGGNPQNVWAVRSLLFLGCAGLASFWVNDSRVCYEETLDQALDLSQNNTYADALLNHLNTIYGNKTMGLEVDSQCRGGMYDTVAARLPDAHYASLEVPFIRLMCSGCYAGQFRV